jgi:hypothetical protein
MINWNELSSNADEAIKNAAKKTDDKLASQISSLTRLKDAEIKEMFPEPSDVKKLAELMAIVKSAEDKNLKISKIIKNSENFAGIIMTLLSKLV